MEIEYIDINQIILADYNPRENLSLNNKKYKAIKKAIKEYGMVEPLLVNKNNNVLVSGHQRLKALKELNYKLVPIIFFDLDSTKEKELNFAINKIKGKWDFEKLELVHADVSHLFTGFDDDFFDVPDDLIGSILDDGFSPSETKKESCTDKKNRKAVTFTFHLIKEKEIFSFVEERGKDELKQLLLQYMRGVLNGN